MTCPKCDGQIDALAKRVWGDGKQSAPFAPYLCGWCASLFLLDCEAPALLDPEDIQRNTGIDVVAAMRANVVMWAAIEQGRRDILALPNRRPVLR